MTSSFGINADTFAIFQAIPDFIIEIIIFYLWNDFVSNLPLISRIFFVYFSLHIWNDICES